MAPGQVWLLALWAINLICGCLDVQELEYLRLDVVRDVCRGIDIALYSFLIIWQFRTVYAIAVSIEQEYKSRSLQVRRRPTYTIGLVMVILSLTYIVDFLPENYFTSTVSQISSFGNMVFWIIYWVQTHRYKKKIQAMPEQQESPIFSNLY
jgi:heme O synthase-like polyprenyltransferase